jgi:hypothetical protein
VQKLNEALEALRFGADYILKITSEGQKIRLILSSEL